MTSDSRLPTSDFQPRGAFFFDRDGTLMHDSGYVSDPDLVRLLPGVRETLQALREAGYLLFLFTNQSGVGRGYFGMDAVEAVNRRLSRLIGDTDDFFDGVCVAPERPDEPSAYRKPSPKFILETLAVLRLDPAACTMVGDGRRDLEAGVRAGVRAIRYSGDIDDDAAASFAAENGIPTIHNFADLAITFNSQLPQLQTSNFEL